MGAGCAFFYFQVDIKNVIKGKHILAKKPAPAPTENKTFISEVDDALREERLATFWARYKMLIIGAVIALFAFVAGKDLYTAHQHNKTQDFANIYAAAEQAEDLAALEDIAASNSPFAPLAAHRAAQISLDKGDTAAAVAQWDNMAANTAVPTFAQDLARFNAANILLTSAPEQAEKRLAPLLTANNPFRLSALELQAQILVARGEKASAAAFYEEIAGIASAPQTLRQRAQQALANLR